MSCVQPVDRTASDSWASISDRERAKRLILEIVRCAGGRLEGKTRLYKIFYFAHLFYAKQAPDYLSEWPIVKMPHGPGIEDGDALLFALRGEGWLDVQPKTVGPYSTHEYRCLRRDVPDIPLEAIAAIRSAVNFAAGETASELSELTHQFSHSWKAAQDGEPLNIYVDLLTEDEYRRLLEDMTRNVNDLRALGEIA